MARALLLACDMPYLTESLLRRLLTQEPGAAVAFRRAERWEPLCALYDAPLVAGVARRRFDAGSHSMQGLLEAVGARRLELAPEELALLDDWDAPEDLARG